jgi:hypothetical protein
MKYPVWNAVAGASNGCRTLSRAKRPHFSGNHQPVSGLNWSDASRNEIVGEECRKPMARLE